MIDRLSPGDRLPSSRELIRRFQVGPATVSQAIAVLAAEGLVVTRPGSGTYVAARVQRRAEVADTAWQTVTLADRSVDTRLLTGTIGEPPAGTIMLDGGYLHRSLQPTQILTAALARAARRPDAWDRAPAGGLAALRSVFAAMAGDGVSADDILVTAGGQSALSMAFRAIAAPGDPVLVESPTYPGAIAAARAAGLRPVPVPMDADGLQPDLLADAFAMTRARLLYCQPTHHNPTGTTLAPQRRRQIVDAARAAGAFVIEDDFARYLGHGTPVPPPLLAGDRHGTVVHLTSLTKPAAPSLRIGALVARGPVLERLRATRLVDDFFVTRPLQEAALELLSSPNWERHLRSLAATLRERCAALAAAVTHQLPHWTLTRIPTGGLHLWVRLPYGTDDTVAADTARQYGVAVSAGHRYFATERPAAYLRLGFAATADRTELTEAARRLASAHEQAAGTR
ncbi:PLP-dependent aminotransferase family protein [Nonomuraea jiangxiensis]|uniref:DNA-binding transcriptional regulator, MocR family, contains an aminotransferase domain n=1 Tax=Nonomuraea jiangxiensis TaxID=633440 RepID=A0A1G8P5V4_9ACTN|nr:PLP-dependent aminotransferase family protein [Nonomuraea jiangxiensis]SDI87874.1 DNA-binding transcriptional regulator, MocR family, contains an aminotransferase domain [Nonomuraea jiangxiensis]